MDRNGFSLYSYQLIFGTHSVDRTIASTSDILSHFSLKWRRITPFAKLLLFSVEGNNDVFDKNLFMLIAQCYGVCEM